MTSKQILISILVAIFCLGLAGVAVSETGSDSNLYERSIGQATDSINSTMNSGGDQMTSFETEGKVKVENGMKAENNSRRLLCASSRGSTSEPHDANCG